MRIRSIVDEVTVAISSRVGQLKRRILGRVAPSYREIYRFRIRSFSSLKKETIQEDLDDKIPANPTIEAEIINHHHFTESRLEPRELMRYHMEPHYRAYRRKTWAIVEVRVSGDWEAGDEVIQDLQNRGIMELSEVEIGVGNRFSESNERVD